MNSDNKVKAPNLNPINNDTIIMMGCDPEFFFLNGKGQVIGSEKVLPKRGLKYKNVITWGYWDDSKSDPIFIIDGVQAELNPFPNTCRALLGNEIHKCFRQLNDMLKQNGNEKLTISFDPLVNITQNELDSLSEKSKIFGCDPSQNVYQTRQQARIKVNPKKYLKRSAGGHIHLGAEGWNRKLRKTLKNVEVMVPILDLVVANTCVLIDRHPGNKERRVNYGRCGEYRLKSYGLEYRSLSNFWLNSYQLMSFVMGMCRQAVSMVYESTNKNNYIDALLNAVSRGDVIRAVQENDWELAYSNFKKIQPILLASSVNDEYGCPINMKTINEFHFFVQKIKKFGLKYWFKNDPFNHWCNLPEGHNRGWESFAKNHIRKDMKKTTTPIMVASEA